MALAVAGTTFGAFNGFFGQLGSDRLRDYCDSGVDTVTLAFVNTSPEHEASKYPGTNFAGHCWAGDYTTPSGVPSDLLSECYYLKQDIPYCKSRGVKIILSIGGEYDVGTSNYEVSSDVNGQYFATFLYYAFGPYQEGYDGPRPFDIDNSTHVAVDGFDFDIEAPLDNGPYIAMINQFRHLDPGMMITGSPQCPTSSGLAYMQDMIQHAQFDRLNIQFYNNPGCMAAPGLVSSLAGDLGLVDSTALSSTFNYDQWEKIVANSDKSKNAKIHVALPASPDAALAGGYLTPAQVKALVCEYKDRPHFGGIAVWDLTRGAGNVVDRKTYNQHVQDALEYGCAAVPTAVPTHAVSTTSATTSKATSTEATSTVAASTEAAETTVLSTSAALTSTATASSSSVVSSSVAVSSSTAVSSADAVSTTAAASSSAVSSSSVAASSSAVATSSADLSSSAVLSSDVASSTAAASNSVVSSSAAFSASAVVSSSDAVSSTAAASSSAAVSSSAIASTSIVASSTAAASGSAVSSSPAAVSTSDAVSSTAAASNSMAVSSSAVASSPVATPSSVASSNAAASNTVIASAPASSGFSTVVATQTTYLSEPSAGLPAPVSQTVGWNLTTAATPTVPMTTSTVYTTSVRTVTECPPSVTDCPVGGVVTETIPLYTTVCPATETQTHKPTTPAAETTGQAAEPTTQAAEPTGASRPAGQAPEPTGQAPEPTQAPVPTTAAASWTTSVVYTTSVHTVTSCGPEVPNCPYGDVVTKTVPLYTTVCPVTEATPVPQPTGQAGEPSGQAPEVTQAPVPTAAPGSWTTSVVYTTSIHTVTSCGPEVPNCPYGDVVTQTVPLYTTICPVTATETGAPSVPETPATTLLAPGTSGIVTSARPPVSTVIVVPQPAGGEGSGPIGTGVVRSTGGVVPVGPTIVPSIPVTGGASALGISLAGVLAAVAVLA